MNQLNKKQIHRLFEALNEELKAKHLTGDLCLVGGAVMCLVLKARDSTADIDAFFAPTTELRVAAKQVAQKLGADPHWLNDGVKGFLSPKGDFSNYLELSHLKISTATPAYMLAMKCLAARIGEEFHDIDDIRYLLKHLGIETPKKAIQVITNYYPLEKLPQKSLYLLDELLTCKT
jgi:hypothetical protein